MTQLNHNEIKSLALEIVQTTSPSDMDVLNDWFVELLKIKASNLSSYEKSKQAILVSHKAKVIWPILKTISKKLKRTIWDDRSLKGRLGIAGISTGMLFFGGQSAGIAALGGAIGVPLWVVLGGGAALAGQFIELNSLKNEIKDSNDIIAVDYEVLEPTNNDNYS